MNQSVLLEEKPLISLISIASAKIYDRKLRGLNGEALPLYSVLPEVIHSILRISLFRCENCKKLSPLFLRKGAFFEQFPATWISEAVELGPMVEGDTRQRQALNLLNSSCKECFEKDKQQMFFTRATQ